MWRLEPDEVRITTVAIEAAADISGVPPDAVGDAAAAIVVITGAATAGCGDTGGCGETDADLPPLIGDEQATGAVPPMKAGAGTDDDFNSTGLLEARTTCSWCCCSCLTGPWWVEMDFFSPIFPGLIGTGPIAGATTILPPPAPFGLVPAGSFPFASSGWCFEWGGFDADTTVLAASEFDAPIGGNGDCGAACS